MQAIHDTIDPPAGAPATLQILAFRLGDEEYGIDIQKVSELRGYDKVTRIANAPAFVKGVMNLRGSIVQIADMRIRFDLGTPIYDAFTVVIVVQVAGQEVGMVVDSVSDVITLARDQIKPPPEVGAARNVGFFTGIGTVDGRMLILVDVDQLMAGAGVPSTEDLAA